MGNQVDLYTGVHKGQRLKFSSISKAAGILNAKNQKALSELEDELAAFRDHMFLHARLEEKFIHPLLSQGVPGGADRLEEDHRFMHKQLDGLVASLGQIRKKPADSSMLDDLALEFYRAWSRFCAFYLSHIDYEEEYVMPTLWKLYTQTELAGAFRQILADQTPKDLMDNLGLMLPAMTPNERFMTLRMGKDTMPPESFQAALKVAEHVLSPQDLEILKTALK